jgi:hypothetical protein
MTKHTQDHPQKPDQAHPSTDKKVQQQKQKAKADEVAGRHKNDGKNDHAGHKTSR